MSGSDANAMPGAGSDGEGQRTQAGGGPSPARKDARGVLCVKCEHLNPIHREECEFCKAHLWVNCHQCGAKNRRVNIRCDECNRRLHKGRSRSGSSRMGRAGLNFWVVGLVIGGIMLTIGLLYVVSGQKWLRLW
jgi:hypothetical protein